LCKLNANCKQPSVPLAASYLPEAKIKTKLIKNQVECKDEKSSITYIPLYVVPLCRVLTFLIFQTGQSKNIAPSKTQIRLITPTVTHFTHTLQKNVLTD
jgi:hypothetical protein